MSNSRKCSTLTIKKKQEIILGVRNGEKQIEVAKRFGIAPSTITSILKKADLYLDLTSNTKRKRQKLSEYPELEERVHTWLMQCRESNIPVGGHLLKEKAKEYATRLGIPKFNASNGWLDNFKKRNNVSFKKVCGESASVDDEVCVQWRENIHKLLENYEPKNIFNADETGLFFKCLPDRTLSLKGQNCHGGKLSKERLTLLLAANADGSEKLTPLMIGKSMKPRCFKNMKTFPMLYRANSKAWMTRNLFLEWLQLVNQQMIKQNRKILLFIDNCPAHTAIEVLSNVHIEFLPPNTTSVLQPLDKGIIKSFKTLYRREVVVKLLESIEENRDYSISVYDAMNIAHKSWTNISQSTIKNCFRACGFINDQSALILSEDLLNIEEWDRVPQNTEKHINFNEYVHVDDDVVITGCLSDDEILGTIADENNENDETLEIPSVSRKVAKASIENLRIFFMASNVDDTIFNEIIKIDNAIDKICQNNVRQKRITHVRT